MNLERGFMDELKQKESILLKNKCHILRMPNTKEKVNMLDAYYSLLQYRQIVMGEELYEEQFDIDNDFSQKYERYIFKDTEKRINEVEANAYLLYDKYQKIIDAYKANGFCEYEYIGFNKVNKKEMEKSIWDFFSILGDDVLKIYYNMIHRIPIHPITNFFLYFMRSGALQGNMVQKF